jgi:hypothetical protein
MGSQGSRFTSFSSITANSGASRRCGEAIARCQRRVEQEAGEQPAVQAPRLHHCPYPLREPAPVLTLAADGMWNDCRCEGEAIRFVRRSRASHLQAVRSLVRSALAHPLEERGDTRVVHIDRGICQHLRCRDTYGFFPSSFQMSPPSLQRFCRAPGQVPCRGTGGSVAQRLCRKGLCRKRAKPLSRPVRSGRGSTSALPTRASAFSEQPLVLRLFP